MQLFALIQSMSRTEKRYLKLFAGFHEGNKQYLRLFDLIAAQKEYDEKAIRKALAGEPMGRGLHVAKHYLYNLILKSLRAYRAESAVDARIQAQIMDARILYEKGLADDCRDALRKGRALAERFERFPYLLEILMLEESFLPERRESDEAIEELLREERETLARIENIAAYDALGNRLSRRIFRDGKPRDEETMGEIDAILTDPLLADESSALSDTARLNFNYIQSGGAFARSDRDRAAHHTMQRLRIIEAHPDWIPHRLYEYSAILVNLLVLHRSASIGGPSIGESHESLMAKLKGLPELARRNGAADERLHYRIFNFGMGLELGYLIGRGRFEEGAALVPEVEEGIKRHRKFLSDADLLRLYFLVASVYLGLGRPAAALEYINRVLGMDDVEYRREVYRSALLLDLLIHYELGNITLIESRVKSVYRYLRRQGSLGRFESILLNYFRKLPGLRTAKETAASFAKLLAELEPLEKDPLEGHAFDNFPFLAWLRSKVTGRSFGEEIVVKGGW